MSNKDLQLGIKTTELVKDVITDKEEKVDVNRVVVLESQVKDLGVMIGNILKTMNSNKIPKANDAVINGETTLNKDGIPVNINLFGLTDGKPYIAYVTTTGYTLGNKHYNSLSAMAQHVTGKRRNGWDFWRDMQGRPVGEVYNGKE